MLITFAKKTTTKNIKPEALVTQRRARRSPRGQGGLGLCGGEGRSPHVLVALLRRQPVCRLPGSASGHVAAGRKEPPHHPRAPPKSRYPRNNRTGAQGGIGLCGTMTKHSAAAASSAILKLRRRKCLMPSDVSISINSYLYTLSVCLLTAESKQTGVSTKF